MSKMVKDWWGVVQLEVVEVATAEEVAAGAHSPVSEQAAPLLHLSLQAGPVEVEALGAISQRSVLAQLKVEQVVRVGGPVKLEPELVVEVEVLVLYRLSSQVQLRVQVVEVEGAMLQPFSKQVKVEGLQVLQFVSQP